MKVDLPCAAKFAFNWVVSLVSQVIRTSGLQDVSYKIAKYIMEKLTNLASELVISVNELILNNKRR